MDLQGINFRFVSNYEIGSLLQKLEKVSNLWDVYTFRQRRFTDHSKTKTVPLIWSEKYDSICFWKNYWVFKEDIELLHSFIGEIYGSGRIMTAILINLPAGKSIGRHIDANPNGKRFNLSRRFHLPLISNESCVFEIMGEEKIMLPGEMWEISNVTKSHSVSNKGESDRIHLLIDWMPEEVYEQYILI